MPTLVEDHLLPTVEETPVEEFDLERLAVISEAQPALEPPRFTLLEPAPRFHFRRTLVMAFLAAVIVSALATLRPGARGPFALGQASQGATTTAGNACSVGN